MKNCVLLKLLLLWFASVCIKNIPAVVTTDTGDPATRLAVGIATGTPPTDVITVDIGGSRTVNKLAYSRALRMHNLSLIPMYLYILS